MGKWHSRIAVNDSAVKNAQLDVYAHGPDPRYRKFLVEQLLSVSTLDRGWSCVDQSMICIVASINSSGYEKLYQRLPVRSVGAPSSLSQGYLKFRVMMEMSR